LKEKFLHNATSVYVWHRSQWTYFDYLFVDSLINASFELNQILVYFKMMVFVGGNGGVKNSGDEEIEDEIRWRWMESCVETKEETNGDGEWRVTKSFVMTRSQYQ